MRLIAFGISLIVFGSSLVSTQCSNIVISTTFWKLGSSFWYNYVTLGSMFWLIFILGAWVHLLIAFSSNLIALSILLVSMHYNSIVIMTFWKLGSSFWYHYITLGNMFWLIFILVAWLELLIAFNSNLIALSIPLVSMHYNSILIMTFWKLGSSFRYHYVTLGSMFWLIGSFW